MYLPFFGEQQQKHLVGGFNLTNLTNMNKSNWIKNSPQIGVKTNYIFELPPPTHRIHVWYIYLHLP